MEAICFFFTQPASYSAHCLHTMLSVTQSAFCTACKCMQKPSGIVFRSNYPGDSPVPLTLPPRRFTVLPVKTGRGRCCYLPGFQHSVTSTGFSALQKPPPASSRYTLPAAPRSLLGGAASDVKLGEAGVNGRLRGATTIRLLLPPPPPSLFCTDFIDFSNLKHSHCRTFCRPIDLN